MVFWVTGRSKTWVSPIDDLIVSTLAQRLDASQIDYAIIGGAVVYLWAWDPN